MPDFECNTNGFPDLAATVKFAETQEAETKLAIEEKCIEQAVAVKVVNMEKVLPLLSWYKVVVGYCVVLASWFLPPLTFADYFVLTCKPKPSPPRLLRQPTLSDL
jgi:hypothetical protein